MARHPEALSEAAKLRLHFSQHSTLATRISACAARALRGHGPARVLLAGPPGSGATSILRVIHDTLTSGEGSPGPVAWVPEIRMQGIHTSRELLFACWDAIAPSVRVPKQPSAASLPAELASLAGKRPIVLILDDLPQNLAFDASRGSFRGFIAQTPGISVIAGIEAAAEAAFREKAGTLSANTSFVVEFISPVRPEEADRYLLQGEACNAGETGAFRARKERDAITVTVRTLAAGRPAHLAALAPLVGTTVPDALSQRFCSQLRDRVAPWTRQRLVLLSPQQRRSLSTLARTGGCPLSVKELSARMHVTSQTCSKQLHELHRAGWVNRHAVGRESRYEISDVLARMGLELQLEGERACRAVLETLFLWHSPLESTPPDSEQYETPFEAALGCAAAAMASSDGFRASFRGLDPAGVPETTIEQELAAALRTQASSDDPAAALLELQCLASLRRFDAVLSRARELALLYRGNADLLELLRLFEAHALAESGHFNLARQLLQSPPGQAPPAREAPIEVRVAHTLLAGRVERALGHAEEALKEFAAAFRHAREAVAAPRPLLIAHALLEKGVLLAGSGATDSAARTLQYAEESGRGCRESATGKLLEGAAALNAGLVLMRAERTDEASDAFDRAVEAASGLECVAARRTKAKALLGQAEVFRARREPATALGAYDAAVAAAETGPFRRLSSEALLAKASLLWFMGRLDDALALYDRIPRTIAREKPGDALPELAQALAGATLAFVAQENADAALGLLEKTVALHRAHADSTDLRRAIVLAIEGFLSAFGSSEKHLGQLRKLTASSSEAYLPRALLLLLKRRLPLQEKAARRFGAIEDVARRAFSGMPEAAHGLALLHAACAAACGNTGILLELPLELRALLEPAPRPRPST